jgi:tetratricopeptide (TPR) repeat protein
MSDEIHRWSDELARDPSSLVFLQLAEALRRQGQLEVALKIALRGVERHVKHVDAHDLIARISVDQRDFNRAVAAWETVLTLQPEHLGAMKGLGYAHFQQHRFDDAERYLSQAAKVGGGSDVTAALEAVRRSSGGVPIAEVEGVPLSDAHRLFADLLVDEGQTAMLLDGNGYVLAGLYLDAAGHDVAQEIGAQLSGISDEVVRSTRHLDLGEWRTMVFETDAAVIAMAPATDSSLLVVAASRATPLGLLRRLLDRCAERARSWLSDGGGR